MAVQDPIWDEASNYKLDPELEINDAIKKVFARETKKQKPNRINKPMDQATLDTLSKVSKDVNDNNEKLLNPLNKISGKYTRISGPVNGTMSTHINATQWNVTNINTGYNTINAGYNTPQGGLSSPVSQPSWNQLDQAEGPTPIEPNPNIDMELDIYKNEFEEIGVVTIGTGGSAYGILENGIFTSPAETIISIGLIDEVSQSEDDIYAKFPDGEIIPFNGHVEKFSIEMSTWNDLKRSDLTGNEIRKAAFCKIYINNKLARIIEGTEIQDLLVKADQAIEQLKVQPFSIARDSYKLVGREIYYDNQPAIIYSVDEPNNLIFIIPDARHLVSFSPPPYAIEDGDSDLWITNFGHGMLVRDYDEKIWWWRNNNGNVDPSTDPFYKQFPQPRIATKSEKTWGDPPAEKLDPNVYYPDGTIITSPYQINPNTYPINPYTMPPYTVSPNTAFPNISYQSTYTDTVTNTVTWSSPLDTSTIRNLSDTYTHGVDDKGNYYFIKNNNIFDEYTIEDPSINRIDTGTEEDLENIKHVNKYYYGRRTGMIKPPKSTMPKKDIDDDIKEVEN